MLRVGGPQRAQSLASLLHRIIMGPAHAFPAATVPNAPVNKHRKNQPTRMPSQTAPFAGFCFIFHFKEKGPAEISTGPLFTSCRSMLYAAICRVSGTDVFTSIFRGRISAAIGALISITPFTYSACSFSTLTPSGSSSTLSNFPYAISFS